MIFNLINPNILDVPYILTPNITETESFTYIKPSSQVKEFDLPLPSSESYNILMGFRHCGTAHQNTQIDVLFSAIWKDIYTKQCGYAFIVRYANDSLEIEHYTVEMWKANNRLHLRTDALFKTGAAFYFTYGKLVNIDQA